MPSNKLTGRFGLVRLPVIAVSLRWLSTCGGVCLGLCALFGPAVFGKYAIHDIRTVPVDRLLANLEEAVKQDPKDVEALINLARVHGMAYASKSDKAQVFKDRDRSEPWFGFDAGYIPFSKVLPTEDKAMQKAASLHLSKAVLGFRKAVKLAPDNMVARMGLAWTLDQSGEKSAAIKEFRALVEDAWKVERDLDGLPPRPSKRGTVFTEAAGYLIPLLDAERDRAEIQYLRSRSKRLLSLPRGITPIAVPLRDGLNARGIVDESAGVAFDADGSGLKKNWTWINGDAGWLVYDPKSERRITSALQLFGSVTFWLFWNTGYDALAALDDNRDGMLTGNELDALAIWHDSSNRGVCDPGEVKPLSEYGIVSVSCRFERDPSHPDHIAFSPAGVTFRDGSTRPTFDIILKTRGAECSKASTRWNGGN